MCNWSLGRKQSGAESNFQEIMAKIFPNMVRPPKSQWTQKVNNKKVKPRHIVGKMLKSEDKEQIMELGREEQNIR